MRTDFKAKLIVGIMFSYKEIYDNAVKDLIEKFGKIEKESLEYDFDKFTFYYEKEMGKGLLKKFIIFKDLINMSQLADIKIFTNNLEKKYSKEGKRLINLDPGYLTKDNLVLASVKDASYKIYLDKRIFAHMIYMFRKDEVIIFHHTFPDFRQENVKEFFVGIRKEIN